MLNPALRYLTASPLTEDPFEKDQLFQTILDRRGAILIAPASTVPLALMAAYFTGAFWPFIWITIDVTLTIWRWRIMVDAEHATPERRRQHAGALVVLGAAWMFSLGVATFLCMTAGNTPVMVTSAVVSTGVACTVTSRNAATPRHALLLLLLLGVPFGVGMLIAPFEGILPAAALTIVWVGSLYMFVRQNHASMLRLIKAETAARRAAETDELTGLFNRSYFEDRRAELDAGAAADVGYGLLCVDLDGFKLVNDNHGHAAGDRLLRVAAARMRDNIRYGDMLFRVGGDEFVALLPAAGLDDCSAIASRLIKVLSKPVELDDGQVVAIGASVGSACTDGVSTTSATLLRAADRALYEAKAGGRGLHVHALMREAA